MKDQIDKPATNLCSALERARSAMLDHERLNAYEPLEPANGRMRGVMDDVFHDGLDQHLWIPPSLPCYGPERSGSPLARLDGRDWEWAAPAVIDAMARVNSVAWVNSPYGFALLDAEGLGAKPPAPPIAGRMVRLRPDQKLWTHCAKQQRPKVKDLVRSSALQIYSQGSEV